MSYWVVWNKKQGAPLKWHNTFTSAKAAAEHLAIKHGTEIILLQMIGACRPKSAATVTEWNFAESAQGALASAK